MDQPARANKPPLPTPTISANDKEKMVIAYASPPAVLPQPLLIKLTQSENAENYASPEWAMFYGTVALAAITAALAIYTAKLYRATVNLGKDAQESGTAQLEKMQKSIEATGRAATAMEDVASATNRQLLLVGMQVDEAIKQTKIYRDQFIATNRPKIILRDATAEQDMNNYIEIEYILSNIGSTKADIVCSALDVRVFKGYQFGPDNLPAIDAGEGEGDGDRIIIEAGEQVTLKFRSAELRWSPANGTCHQFTEPEFGLFFYGQIVYDDVAGVRRRTGFRRKYDTHQNRFLGEDADAHYEFHD